MLEDVEELSALLLVNLVRDDDGSRHHVPVVVQDAQVTLDRYLCVTEALDTARIRANLRLKIGGCALIHAVENYDISLVHHASVVDRHFPTPSIPN